MEREMCSYLEWNLNVMGDEVGEFEARIRAEHGPKVIPEPPSNANTFYPTPQSTPIPQLVDRPIRPVPSPHRNRSSYASSIASTLPSPPSSPGHFPPSSSPQPPHFASAYSSLASSPASDDCKTPSPVTQTLNGASSCSRVHSSKPVDMSLAFEGRQRQHATNIALNGYSINVAGW